MGLSPFPYAIIFPQDEHERVLIDRLREAGVNLAWKLADVLKGRAPMSLLDSYERERMGFARRLVATTDRAFSVITSRGSMARFVRRRIVPVLVPLVFRARAARRLMYRTISQTGLSYRDSPLSVGRAGGVHGGDRLPWLKGDDNFAPLDSLDWQVHVYGEATLEIATACRERGLALHVFPWRSQIRRTRLRRNALYLVRPDGHVALADPDPRASTLTLYLDQHLQGAGAAQPLRAGIPDIQ